MIFAIMGPIGHGKSFLQLRMVIEAAQRQRRWIVSNVPLNLDVLHSYCIARKFYWLAAELRRGHLFVDDDFARISSYGNCVVLADELGVFMNNREGLQGDEKKLRMRFIKALILSRKAKMDLYWVAQDEEMVDQQIRKLTQFFWHTYNSEARAQRSTSTRYFIRSLFESSTRYQKWFTKQTFGAWNRNKLGWGMSMPGNKLWCKVFGNHDELLFGAYDTNYRLDKSDVHTMDLVANDLGFGVDELEGQRPLQVPGHMLPMLIPEGYVIGERAELLEAPRVQSDMGPVLVDEHGYTRAGIRWVRTIRSSSRRRERWKRDDAGAPRLVTFAPRARGDERPEGRAPLGMPEGQTTPRAGSVKIEAPRISR